MQERRPQKEDDILNENYTLSLFIHNLCNVTNYYYQQQQQQQRGKDGYCFFLFHLGCCCLHSRLNSRPRSQMISTLTLLGWAGHPFAVNWSLVSISYSQLENPIYAHSRWAEMLSHHLLPLANQCGMFNATL